MAGMPAIKLAPPTVGLGCGLPIVSSHCVRGGASILIVFTSKVAILALHKQLPPLGDQCSCFILSFDRQLVDQFLGGSRNLKVLQGMS